MNESISEVVIERSAPGALEILRTVSGLFFVAALAAAVAGLTIVDGLRTPVAIQSSVQPATASVQPSYLSAPQIENRPMAVYLVQTHTQETLARWGEAERSAEYSDRPYWVLYVHDEDGVLHAGQAILDLALTHRTIGAIEVTDLRHVR